jgi:hypothetical protein
VIAASKSRERRVIAILRAGPSPAPRPPADTSLSGVAFGVVSKRLRLFGKRPCAGERRAFAVYRAAIALS